jgi:hypothetical protein
VTPAEVEALDKLFGSPEAADQLRYSKAPAEKEHEARGIADRNSSIPDSALAATIDAYISVLSANMHDKMFQFDSWTRIEDLWSFLQLVLLRCTLDTLFGSALLKHYPRMVRDYLDFNGAVEGYLPGMPRIMISGVGNPRNRLHQGIKSWLGATCDRLRSTDTFSEAGSAKNKPLWDENMGLQPIREHYNACYSVVDKLKGSKLQAMAADVLSIIHTYVVYGVQRTRSIVISKLMSGSRINTELVSSAFWMTIETLRKPHLTRNITASIGQHFSPITHKYDIIKLAQEPLVKSIQTETRRLRTATYTVRTNQTDGFPLDKHWYLPKGATVAMFSHDISLNADVWKKLQPRALEKPLGEFWAERFTVSGQKGKSKENVGTELSDAATEDLGDLVTRLATCDQYPGSHFISALQLATLAVLFAEFQVQLCDTDEVDAALPPVHEFAYGTVKPLEKVAVRIRKRKT